MTPIDSSTEVLPASFHLPERIGPFLIHRLIGRGGMGAVYEATHERLDRPVALKVLPNPMSVDPEYHIRFAREARAVGRLDHPNVVRATDAGDADGVPYLAMELVDGIDVARLVKDLGPLPVPDTVEIAAQAAAGLAHAHARGVIHRDVKPSNIMVTAEGSVKLLDLGLALCVEAAAGPGDNPLTGRVYLGTHDYMAPEQWTEPSSVTSKADVYALGCVLFQMLSGHPPFAEFKAGVQKMKAHSSTTPADLTLRPDMPPMLAVLIQRMLAKEPAERPTILEVETELQLLRNNAQLPRLVERSRHVGLGRYHDGDPTRTMPAGSPATSFAIRPMPELPSKPISEHRYAGIILWLLAVVMLSATLLVVFIVFFRLKPQ